MTFTEADFHKSSLSDPQQACVSVARRDGRVEIREALSERLVASL